MEIVLMIIAAIFGLSLLIWLIFQIARLIVIVMKTLFRIIFSLWGAILIWSIVFINDGISNWIPGIVPFSWSADFFLSATFWIPVIHCIIGLIATISRYGSRVNIENVFKSHPTGKLDMDELNCLLLQHGLTFESDAVQSKFRSGHIIAKDIDGRGEFFVFNWYDDHRGEREIHLD